MRVVGGISTVVTHAIETDIVALVLGEPPDQPPATQWDVYVDVLLEEAGFCRLGAIRTRAVANRRAPQRVIAYAACPGARGWRVTIGSAVANARAELFICGTPHKAYGWTIGVYPNDPMFRALGTYTPDADYINW